MGTTKKPETVKVKVPKIPGEDPFIIVFDNAKSYQIKRGVWVDVPKGVAETLEFAEMAETIADNYIADNAN